jgi:cell fate regulator YaaT (PSP1 superfamily)
MSDIICVVSERFGKLYWVKKEDFDIKKGDHVIIESELGGELAVVKNISSKVCGSSVSNKDIVEIVSIATEDDIKKFAWLEKKEKSAFHFCLQRIEARKLPMKLVRVRYFFNEKKGIFYYTADGRIDFRLLVKDLAKEFKMRIEMRQIGVRDEAKMIGGLGVCGRTLCCFSFLRNFEPVTIQKAKKQQIVINPTKISGLCGRLMCCLAFEEETPGRMYAEEEKVEEN